MSRKIIIALNALLLLACERYTAQDVNRVEQLKEKRKLYCELSKDFYLKNKFVNNKCDGLLWTALHGIGCDYITSLDDFKNEENRWFRSPTHDCFKNGSDSSISKDMFAGLILYSLYYDRKDYIQSIVDYGEKHNWIMGEAIDTPTLISKCILPPSTILLLYHYLGKIKFKLNSDYEIEDEDVSGIAINVGYGAHLDMLRILRKYLVYKSIGAWDMYVLEEQAKRQPLNALYQAVYHMFKDGDMSLPQKLLLSDKYFPNDRLPTSNEYCTWYLYQRDAETDDWLPCPHEGHTHSGTDFIFAATVTLGELKK